MDIARYRHGYFILSKDRKIIMDPSRGDANEYIDFSVDNMVSGADQRWDAHPYDDDHATLRTHSIGFILRSIKLEEWGGRSYYAFMRRKWVDAIQQEAILVYMEWGHRSNYHHGNSSYIIPSPSGNVYLTSAERAMDGLYYKVLPCDGRYDILYMLWGKSDRRRVAMDVPFFDTSRCLQAMTDIMIVCHE